jgi:phage gp29-like protein
MNKKNYLTSELASFENLYRFNTYFGMLPNPDLVLRRTGKGIEAYRDLKNDPHVWSCIQSRKSGVLSLEYIISPNGCLPELVDKVERIFDELDVHQIESDILEAPLFGYQPVEIIWENGGGGENFLLKPVKLVAKPQEWFYFDLSGSLCYRKAGEPAGTPVPQMKFLDVRYEQSYLNPYGHSLLSKCYWPVTFKNGGIRFWVNFAEKYGMPILMGQYTRGATFDEMQKLAEELNNMTEDAVIVAPADITLQMHEASRTTSVALFRELIKHCNSEISKAILSQTLTTEMDAGSYAASMTHFKIRQEIIQSDIRLVESAFNTLIRYIVDLNFGGSKYPKFNLLINDADNLQKVERDVKIASTGVRFTKKYWMNSYGFKEEEVEEE